MVLTWYKAGYLEIPTGCRDKHDRYERLLTFICLRIYTCTLVKDPGILIASIRSNFRSNLSFYIFMSIFPVGVDRVECL